MTDPSYVHYIFIIDRSGSMHTIREDTEGGLRAFIDRQLEGIGDAKRTVSLYQFDTEHDCVYSFAPLASAKDYKLVPRGGTALLDACGMAIQGSGKLLAKMPEDERPYQVTVVIATDGQENSSHSFTRDGIRKMITHQQDKYNWKFTYIGANQDAFAEAGSIGIPVYATMDYAPAGTYSAWGSAGVAASMSTVSTTSRIIYTEEQRRDAVKK
jgi:hypothetical protein